MPQTIELAAFVLGAVLLLLALTTDGFKIFGAEMGRIAGRGTRPLAGLVGAALIGFALWHTLQEGSAAPQPKPPSATEQDSTRAPSRAQEQSPEEVYNSAEQRVMREARLSGSMNTIEESVRPGEWNRVDTVSDYDPQACDTKAMNVRLANRPLHGEFRSELTTVSYSVQEECRMVSGPATAIYYRPNPGYWGKDIFSYITPDLDRTTVVRTKGVGTQ